MFPPIHTLLPQQGTALLLDRVLAHSAESTRCGVRIEPTHPYRADGRVAVTLALELLAQTCAARAALDGNAPADEKAVAGESATDRTPRKGYVVAVPRLELLGGDFLIGEQLEICVSPLHLSDSLVKYAGEVTVDGSLRARGELSVLLVGES
ncbi:MAG TPA: hypothetical protein VLC09_20825 [Polyangiaceae bacterium]|nr:hypothetical protein [Polyangiaceae bacterium]